MTARLIALSCFCRRHHVAAGTLVLAVAYLLGDVGWRETGKAALVYALGAYALSAPWLPASAALLLTGVWRLGFVADLGVRALLLAVYHTRPDTVLVVDAVANTTSEESAEFLMQYWRLLLLYGAGALLLGLLLTLIDRRYPRAHLPSPVSAVVVALLFAGLHFNPTFRKSNPLYFWPSQLAQVQAFQQNIERLRADRERAQASLPDWAPVYTGAQARHTVGIVIGESTTRWNWQLYGYTRATTPELSHAAASDPRLSVFRDVIAATSGTVSSFRYMLTPLALDEPLDDEAAPSVLMLARAAGYKVFWISNQHDRYINPRFAEEADVQKLLNVGGKRGDRRLDEALIPEWQAALRDPAPRKLIIAHLLGAHPHYELRYPKAYSHYVGVQDEVSRKLADQGRMPWIRVQRDQYDNAMRYQDHVIATLLRDFQRQAGTSAAFLFTSDHGQDVGHMRNFAGHSTDMPGMVVPLLLWRNDAPPATPALQMRAFQNDVLDWTLLDLLDVQTRRDRPELSLIDPAFAPRVRRVQSGNAAPGATDPEDLPVVP